MAAEPRWLAYEEVVAINAEQIARFGGLSGIKDANLIHSALARPRHRFLYEGQTDTLTLAVDVGVAVARNHGFADGNKRTGFVAMALFLRVNGYRLDAPDDESLGRMLEAVLVRELTEAGFADHLASFVHPI